LIPHFYEVQKIALAEGVLGCSISGSGPSIFALSQGMDTAQQVGQAMQAGFATLGIQSNVYVSSINQQGPIVLD
jgi:homoserine kinase